MGINEDEDFCFKCVGGGCCLSGLVILITVLASIKSLGPDDQLIVHYLDGNYVYNGPAGAKVYNPFREKTSRKAVKLNAKQYCRIRDSLNGGVRTLEGTIKEFMGPYETLEGQWNKDVLKSGQYIRYVDKLSGVERIEKGPASVRPKDWEHAPEGIQQASYVNADTAVVLLNKVDGSTSLYMEPGLFIPNEYVEVVDTVTRMKVPSTEVLVVRGANGGFTIHSGTTSFFLRPFEEILQFSWSVFSNPEGNVKQVITKDTFTRIDKRMRKTFFQYDVRTIDNVALRVEGAIFWQIEDIAKVMEKTADPVSDVWYKGRNTLMQAVSQVTLINFQRSFGTLIKGAYMAEANSTFYSNRGIKVLSMDVLGYDVIDEETAQTLQAIIEQATETINALQKQKNENDVNYAALKADIKLAQERTNLIVTQAKNDILAAEMEGQAEGVQLAFSATTFIDGLNSSLPDIDKRVELYKLLEDIDADDRRSSALASNKKATFFFTPEEMSLDLAPTEL